jgi:hypothetical protein
VAALPAGAVELENEEKELETSTAGAGAGGFNNKNDDNETTIGASTATSTILMIHMMLLKMTMMTSPTINAEYNDLLAGQRSSCNKTKNKRKIKILFNETLAIMKMRVLVAMTAMTATMKTALMRTMVVVAVRRTEQEVTI